jgi:uncharacterized protein YndB with AHSA1/START domain
LFYPELVRTIRQTYHINAPVEKVWDALVNPDTIQRWSGDKAEMKPEKGFSWKLWSGQMHGENVEVITEKKLVQTWLSDDLPPTSLATFTLNENEEGTTLELLHENVSDEEFDNYSIGWDEHYCGAIKQLLET